MLHKIKSDKPDEVHFYVGRKRCRFGRVEFGLVTGLNLLPGPTEEDIKQNGSSDRLIQEYFNGSASITFGQLRRVFESCTEADDVYKLGMALFVMGVLTGKEEKTAVPPFVIRMVDNLPFFYEYPWGKISYTKLMESCNKDYLDVKNKMLKKIEKGVTQKEAKYSAYDYAAALQYWAYEAILQLGNEYAVRRSHGFPRMVNWESKPKTTLGKDEVTRLFAKNLTVYSVLCPRPNEIEFVSYITGGQPPLFVDLEELVLGEDGQPTQDALRSQAEKLASTLEERAEAARIFKDSTPPPPSPPRAPPAVPDGSGVDPSPASVPDGSGVDPSAASIPDGFGVDPLAASQGPPVPPSASIPSTSEARDPVYPAILARLETVERGQAALLRGQTAIMDQLKTIMTLLQDPGRPAADSQPQPQPQPQPEEEARTPEDDFILPNDYQPDDDDMFCTPEKTNITSIGDTQDSEVQVLETAPEVMENRRKRRRPRWFAQYTEMKKKARATSTLVNADPLRVVDRKLLKTFHNWVLGQIGNNYPRECFTGRYHSSWFLELHTPKFWLGNDHLDAAFHLMRRRQHFYPESYPNRCVIMPCIFPAGVIARWEAAGDDQANYQWDESILDLIRGDESQFLASWKNKERIYMALYFDGAKHWVALEIDLDHWLLNIFDSSLGSISPNELNRHLAMWEKLLPNLLLQAGLFESHDMILLPQLTASESQVRNFTSKVMDRAVVPQTKTSGNCGMYVIEHIEHSMLETTFDNVHDENMKKFRERWCVDLFYQNLA
ncbi:hypothetical protein CsatB_024139 [Cannabis sativa]